jgi:hypothetical protein
MPPPGGGPGGGPGGIPDGEPGGGEPDGGPENPPGPIAKTGLWLADLTANADSELSDFKFNLGLALIFSIAKISVATEVLSSICRSAAVVLTGDIDNPKRTRISHFEGLYETFIFNSLPECSVFAGILSALAIAIVFRGGGRRSTALISNRGRVKA